MRKEDTIAFLIETKYASLRTSEKKAADYVLEHMDEVMTMSLSEFARRSGVSQPTVVRFVNALGFDGYRAFKFRLICEHGKQDEAGTVNVMYGYEVTGKDELRNIPARITATVIRMMEENLKSISVDTFENVVRAIVNAEYIEIYGVENSGSVCSDLCTKLTYLGMKCRYYEDPYMQCICAGNLRERDVAIGISYSGYSIDTVDALKMAKKQGALTIAITNFQDSLISRYADYVICSTQEQFLYGKAIFSRTAQLAIVDMIYLGVIVSDYDRFIRALDRNSELIRHKAYRTD